MARHSVTFGALIGRLGLNIALLAMLTGCTGPQSFAGAKNQLFSPALQTRGRLDEAMRPKMIRHRFVNVDIGTLLPAKASSMDSKPAAGAVVVLHLFDDAVFRAVLDRRETRSANSFTWFGHIPGADNSQVTLVVEEGVLSGNITVDQSLYQVRYAGDGTHVIYQIDPNAFPPEGKPLPVPDRK